MHKPKQLTDIDLSEIYTVFTGGEEYDLTRDNFNTLIHSHNNLVEVVNMLIEEHPNQLIKNKLKEG